MIANFLWTYPNQIDLFAYPAGLNKAVEKVPIGCSYLLTSIDYFYFSKVYFKFIIKDIFCWLLTCYFVLNALAFIDPDTFSWVWYQNFCGTYLDCTYKFAFPAGLRKVSTRMLVVWFYLSIINVFTSCKISITFFSCLLLCPFFCQLNKNSF